MHSIENSDAARTRRRSTRRRIGESAAGIVLVVVRSATIGAQVPAPHPLGPVMATSVVSFAEPSQVIVAGNGRVFVLDYVARMVTMLDPSLGNPIVVFDSARGLSHSYPAPIPAGRAGAVSSAPNFLSRFRGDSVLWFDGSPRQFTVIGPDGRPGRVIPAPAGSGPSRTTSGSATMTTGGGPFSPMDPAYWSEPLGLVFKQRAAFSTLRPVGAGASIAVRDESASVVRKHYGTGVQDTLAGIAFLTRVLPPGPSSYMSTFSFTDELVVTSDGTVCIFHARDFRFEWIGADRRSLPAAPVANVSRPLTDADRQRLVDSVNAGRRRDFDSAVTAWSAATGRAPPSRPRFVELVEVPNVLPPTAGMRAITGIGVSSSMLADGDNRVWLRVADPGGDASSDLWLVIGRTEGVIDRVRIPTTHTLRAVAAGGIAIVAVRESGRTRLETRRVRP